MRTRYIRTRLFMCNTKVFSSGSASFLTLSAAGHAGARPACTQRKRGSWPGSVARAPGVLSREIWQVIARLLSDQLNRPNQAMQHPQKGPFFLSFFHLSAAVQQVTQQPSEGKQSRYNSHASNFFLCDSRERYLRVCVRA